MATTDSPPQDAPSPEAQLDTARVAGRGGVAVLGAKVFFILVGFVQVPLLQSILGKPEFGSLSRVMSVANIVNNVVVQSSTQGVSRAVVRARGQEAEALRATLRVHVPLALVLTALCAALAPLVAWFQDQPSLTLPMILLSGVILCYGLYAPLIGSLNGRSLFTRQAALDVTFAVLRTAGLLGVGYFFVASHWSGKIGATIGFVVASVCIVPIAVRFAGTGRRAQAPSPNLPSTRPYLMGLLAIGASQLFINLLMQVDFQVAGRFLSISAKEGGLEDAAADAWVTVYRDCQTFAFLPYQLVFSVTQILFPMVARAKAEGDKVALREYVRRGSRVGTIVCGLFVSVVIALPWTLLNFAFGNAAGDKGLPIADSGANPLRVMAIAQAAFAVLGIAMTILNSIGKERLASIITLGAALVIGAGCWVILPMASFGGEQLLFAASAAGVGLVIALVVAAGFVKKETGSFLPLATLARVGLGVAACATLGYFLPQFTNRLLAPILAVGIVLVYVMILVVTREITRADLAMVKAMVSRKKK